MSAGSAAILLDHIKNYYGTESDSETGRRLGVHPQHICSTRSGKRPVGASLILAIHEEFDMPVAEIRRLSGMEKS